MAITAVDRLRLLLDDKLPSGGTDQDAYFSTTTLTDLLSANGDNLYLTAAECWAIKAGDYAELIDRSESGSEVKLSKMFEQAAKQATYYMKLAESTGANSLAGASSVVAKVASLRERSLNSNYDVVRSRRGATWDSTDPGVA